MSSSHVTTTLAQGALVAGKYRLQRLLGEGAMGVVWSARNEHTSGQVALKLILGPGPELRLRLLHEAQACCQIQHKNVIQIHDVGQTESGDPFLVMELLSGETLAGLLGRKRRLNQREAAVIGRDVARALSAAHDKGIVHRDLKPANIFLHNQPGEDARVVKVLDFGVSKNLLVGDGLQTMLGGPVGSPSYMSPEQACGGRDIDARADIWSLGVLLFEMLTGERPFLGEAQEVIDRILRAEIPVPSRRVRNVDPGLDRLISGCLTRDREQRSWPIADVVQGLEPFTLDPPRATTPTLTALWGMPAALQPPPSSRRAAAVLLGGASESDAETQRLEAENLATFAVQDRAPRAVFVPDVPAALPCDATVRMFSSEPLPALPHQTGAARSPEARPTTATLPAATDDAGSPAIPPTPWTSPTPPLAEAPPPKRGELLLVRAFVACMVVVVVLLLAFTHGPRTSVAVDPETQAAVGAEASSVLDRTPSPLVTAEKPTPIQAVLPEAGAPEAPSTKRETGARPHPRVVAPKPLVTCGRFVKTGCDASPSK